MIVKIPRIRLGDTASLRKIAPTKVVPSIKRPEAMGKAKERGSRLIVS
jgi:hypothetical protein